MENSGFRRIAWLAAIGLMALSCSTTRVLQDGQYRLAGNKIQVDDRHFKTGELSSYIRQKPNSYFIFGWNPFLNLYNWSGNDTSKGINRFLRKVGVAPVVYDASQVDASIENMLSHLEYIGYYGSEVDSRITLKKRRVYVNYYVTLGKRFPISSIRYEVPESDGFSADFERDIPNILVKKGDYMAESVMEEESERGAKYFRNKGFYGFDKTHYSFVADTLTEPGKAAMTMTIREYSRNDSQENAVPLRKFRIGDVKVTQSQRLSLRKSVIENLNTVIPGSLYAEKVVSNTYSRLSSLGVISGVNISLNQSGDDTVDCDISLQNSRLQGFKVNLEASTNSTGLIGISPQLSYFNRNIFHGGELFNMSFIGNFQFKPRTMLRSNELGTSLSLKLPQFVGLPNRIFKGPMVPKTDIKASFNYQDRPEYTRTIISTSYGYSGNVGGRFYFQVSPVQLGIVRLFNIDENFYSSLQYDPYMQNAYQNHFDLGLGSTFYYTTNSDVNPTTSYHYYRLDIGLSGNLLSVFNRLMKTDNSGAHLIWNTPYSQYVRVEAQMGRTFVFGRKDRQGFAFRLLAGIGHAYGNSSVLPFEQFFYSGGSGSLRGWQARTVGPGLSQLDKSFVIPNQNGDMKLEANVEYRFPLFWKFRGCVFVDAGNIWDIHASAEESEKFSFKTFPQSIAADWGLGLRLDLNFILVRLDFGMKMHDPSRPEGERWIQPQRWFKSENCSFHFGVGYPF